MSKNALLFELIQSLSRSEKRYFKLYFSTSGTNTNYLKLFNAIERQQVYDEPAIKAQFAGETFVRQLHVTKHYLRNLILKSLRNFHAHISKDAELKDVLRNIEILFHKEQYAGCKVELEKAASLATAFELHAGLVEVEMWKRKIEQAQAPHHYEAFLKAASSQQRAIDKLYNTNRYWQLAIRISRETISQRNHPVEDDHLLDDPANALSLEATVLHYNARFFQCLRSQQNEQAQQNVHAEQALYDLIAFLEAHPRRIAENPAHYTSSVNNMVSFLVFQKKYEPALELVQQAKRIYEHWKITSERKTLFKQIMRTYNIELEIYRDTRAFDQKEAFISEIEVFVSKHRHKIPKSYLLSFWFQLANVHFMQQHFEKALSWINEILNTRYRDVRIDLQIHARMINLMIHLEQQNLFVLRYFVDSTRRFLKKQGRATAHESILLKFFSNIAQTPVLEYRDKFKMLKTELFPEGQESLVNDSLDYIDYRRWIEEHIGEA